MSTATATDRPLPSDETMAMLLALADGWEVLCVEETGQMIARLADGKPVEICGEALDDLTEREWVTVDDDTMLIDITQTGDYWLEKWLKRQGSKLKANRRTHKPKVCSRPRLARRRK